MLELVLRRIAKRKGYTIGRLTLNGERFCDTLEPIWRDYEHGEKKVKGCSAIPEGRYAVALTFSPKFRRVLPEVKNVPMFTGIRIHSGNSSKDTQGCILIGQNLQVGRVLNSMICLEQLMKRLKEVRNKGEPIFITIQ